MSLAHCAAGTRTPAGTGPPAPGAAAPSPLGIVPHQVRGSVGFFSQALYAAPAFPRCTACSATVVREYRADKGEFLLRVFRDPCYLEDRTGLTAMKEEVDDAAWLGEDSDGDDF